ncbi:MAG: HD domain-containing phosphohydrolase [Clostridiaceae bacterium]
MINKSNSNLLILGKNNNQNLSISSEKCWKILVLCKDMEILKKLKENLYDNKFMNQNFLLLGATTLKECKELIVNNKDIAVAILDYAFNENGEDNSDTFSIINFIRDYQENNFMKIVVFTYDEHCEFPQNLIEEYDINDFRFFKDIINKNYIISLNFLLKTYTALINMEYSKQGHSKIIEYTQNINDFKINSDFGTVLLFRIYSLLGLSGRDINYKKNPSFVATKINADYKIIAANGIYKSYANCNIKDIIHPSSYNLIHKMIYSDSSYVYLNNTLFLHVHSKSGNHQIILIDSLDDLSSIDINLIDTFCKNISITLDNLYLNKEIETTQKEIIYTLGEISEARSKETGNHVKRVAEYSKIIAHKYGLAKSDCESLALASPMHDVGKLAIPDSILNKPGKLTTEEFEIMKTHSLVGYEMLKNSNKRLLKTASIIALQHHEKYDGTGYPYGLKDEDIHIFGRIIAVADVFDALGSDRAYKKAWSLESILDLFKDQRGKHFDPVLVDIFFDNLNDFIEIRDSYLDVPKNS